MSKIKNGGLDQYGAGPFEQHQFGTAGVERVNKLFSGFSPKFQEILYRLPKWQFFTSGASHHIQSLASRH